MNFSSKNVAATNTSSPMKPGPEVKCELTKLEVDEKGNVKVVFQNETGTLSKTEFKIDPTHEKYDAEKSEWTMERLVHIFTAFIPQEQLDTIEETTFEAWAKRAIALVGDNYKGKECTLKVVVNKKNFVDLPTFTNFLSTEFRPCTWNVNPKYDKFEFSADTPDTASGGETQPAVASPSVDEEDEDF